RVDHHGLGVADWAEVVRPGARMKMKDWLGRDLPVESVRRGHGIDATHRSVPVVAGPADCLVAPLGVRVEWVLVERFPMAEAAEAVVADDHVILLGPERVVHPQARAI